MNRFVVLLMLVGLAGGCGKQAVQNDTPAVVTAVERAPLVAGYEALRDRFANDDLDGVKATAASYAKVAAGAGEEALGKQADATSKQPDLVAARLAFGELSRMYFGVLSKKAELAQGLFAFRCPMAEGYQKRVQVDETMKNPYMGKRMLECGSKTDFVP